MDRFFVPAGILKTKKIVLERELSHRLRHVLRLRSGDHVILLDGRGSEHEVEIEEVDSPHVTAHVVAQHEGLAEPKTRVTLYQSLIKGDRFDWVLEKGTEIGVSRFVPLLTRRSVMRPRPERFERSDRWQRIVREAAEQCGRSVLPEVTPPMELPDALKAARGLCLLPWENEDGVSLRSALRQAVQSPEGVKEVSLFIGPEGGFARQEVDSVLEQGMRTVSLGSRILRSETAGIVAAAAVLYELGELGD